MKGSAGDRLPPGHVCLWIKTLMLVGTKRAGHRNTHHEVIPSETPGVLQNENVDWGLKSDRHGVRIEWGKEKKPCYERCQPANVGVRGACQMCDLHDDFIEVMLLILWTTTQCQRWNISPFSLLFGFAKLALFWIISGWFYVWSVIPNGRILTVWYLRSERFLPARKSRKLTPPPVWAI